MPPLRHPTEQPRLDDAWLDAVLEGHHAPWIKARREEMAADVLGEERIERGGDG